MRLALIVSAAVLAPVALLAQKVTQDWDHGADFSQYHTYRWGKVQNAPQMNQLTEQRIIAAVDEELAKKGLHRVDTGGDLVVTYQAAVTQETQWNTFNDGYGPWGWGGGFSTTTQDKIPVGMLRVDMYAAGKKQLVYTANATDTLSDNPEKNTKKIDKAVEKMFDKYPPKP